ncbi:hypothetical protein C0991_002249, partial [Blastosporella zonata]
MEALDLCDYRKARSWIRDNKDKLRERLPTHKVKAGTIFLLPYEKGTRHKDGLRDGEQ